MALRTIILRLPKKLIIRATVEGARENLSPESYLERRVERILLEEIGAEKRDEQHNSRVMRLSGDSIVAEPYDAKEIARLSKIANTNGKV